MMVLRASWPVAAEAGTPPGPTNTSWAATKVTAAMMAVIDPTTARRRRYTAACRRVTGATRRDDEGPQRSRWTGPTERLFEKFDEGIGVEEIAMDMTAGLPTSGEHVYAEHLYPNDRSMSTPDRNFLEHTYFEQMFDLAPER